MHDLKQRKRRHLLGVIVLVTISVLPGISFSIPTPVVNTISPSSTIVDGVGFTLTVNGSGFEAPTSSTPGTVVMFRGFALPTTYISPTQITAMVPGLGTTLTRMDLARLTILSQLSENGITSFLNSTGGIFCSFADVSCPGPPGGMVTDSTGVSSGWRYSESMYRLSYYKGCQTSNDPLRLFCPTDSVNWLGTVGIINVHVLTTSLGPPLVPLTSNSVDFNILPRAKVPTLSVLGFLALMIALFGSGIMALRRPRVG